VTPPAARDGPDNPCLVCHADAAAQHASWLPNAGRHVDTVACAACHVPDAMRRVDLRLHASGQPLRVRDGAEQFARRARTADADHNGRDASELRALLAEFERDVGSVSLRGGVELRSGIDAHELPPKQQVLRLRRCHDADAPLFRFVTVSVLDTDGRPVRYDAHREILSAALTWEAPRGFYGRQHPDPGCWTRCWAFPDRRDCGPRPALRAAPLARRRTRVEEISGEPYLRAPLPVQAHWINAAGSWHCWSRATALRNPVHAGLPDRRRAAQQHRLRADGQLLRLAGLLPLLDRSPYHPD
jgi:hypothetical protein